MIDKTKYDFICSLAVTDYNFDKENRTISGYACHFGKRNEKGHIFDKNSFKNFLAYLESKNLKLPMTYCHNVGLPIGRWEEIIADDLGLFVKGILSDIPFVNTTVIPQLEDGTLQNLSVHGGPDGILPSIDRKTNSVFYKKAKLHEIALVALGGDFDAKPKFVNSIYELNEYGPRALAYLL